MSEFDLPLSIVLGVGLAAATGFRVFLPMLVVSGAAYAGHLPLDIGPPSASRPALEAELRRQLRSAAYDEEALIELAIDQRIDVERRSDADPKAVLCIAFASEVAQKRLRGDS